MPTRKVERKLECYNIIFHEGTKFYIKKEEDKGTQ